MTLDGWPKSCDVYDFRSVPGGDLENQDLSSVPGSEADQPILQEQEVTRWPSSSLQRVSE